MFGLYRCCALVLIFSLFSGGLLLASTAMPPLPPPLVSRMAATYGPEAATRLMQWQQLLLQQHETREWHQLHHINVFMNKVPFKSDAEHWGLNDYWATPAEFLSSNGGDCEDFAIAKLFSLHASKVNPTKLRLMYVNATTLNQPHIVLVYKEGPGEPLFVLDNLTDQILPTDQRPDLEPIYSFNMSGLWLTSRQGLGQQVRNHSGSTLWEDLITRIGREGFNI